MVEFVDFSAPWVLIVSIWGKRWTASGNVNRAEKPAWL